MNSREYRLGSKISTGNTESAFTLSGVKDSTPIEQSSRLYLKKKVTKKERNIKGGGKRIEADSGEGNGDENEKLEPSWKNAAQARNYFLAHVLLFPPRRKS